MVAIPVLTEGGYRLYFNVKAWIGDMVTRLLLSSNIPVGRRRKILASPHGLARLCQLITCSKFVRSGLAAAHFPVAPPPALAHCGGGWRYGPRHQGV
jgi:hypothetical protein